jgi:hypothetical protein
MFPKLIKRFPFAIKGDDHYGAIVAERFLLEILTLGLITHGAAILPQAGLGID